MSARDAVLGKVRRALGVAGDEPDRRQAVALRLEPAKPNLVPQRAQVPHAEQIALFGRMGTQVGATIVSVPSRDDLPEAIADALRQRNLPQSLRMGADTRLASLPWDRAPTLERLPGPSDGSDLAGLSHAFAGIAETGTVALVSGEDNPTTVNFLPDLHMVVVDAADMVGDYETVWTRIRERYGVGQMPRTVNLVTGPSRSGDIEQTLIMGAHGPRELLLFVVGEG